MDTSKGRSMGKAWALGLTALILCSCAQRETDELRVAASPSHDPVSVLVNNERIAQYPIASMMSDRTPGTRVDDIIVNADPEARYATTDGQRPVQGQDDFMIFTRYSVQSIAVWRGGDPLAAVVVPGGSIDGDTVLTDEPVPLEAGREYIVVTQPSVLLGTGGAPQVVAAMPVSRSDSQNVLVPDIFGVQGLPAHAGRDAVAGKAINGNVVRRADLRRAARP
jgi:hypothetical protein